jgi:hypothetical protein
MFLDVHSRGTVLILSVMAGRYDPLPIRDRVDEQAAEVYLLLRGAWRTYQDSVASEGDRQRGERLIRRLYAAARFGRRGGLNERVEETYGEMLRLAGAALEERRDVMREYEEGRRETGLQEARRAANAAAVDVIMERLVGPQRQREGAAQRLAERWRERLERFFKGPWRVLRADGLARELTALALGLSPRSISVLRHRARRRAEG